jgi:oxygen-dependent protoporphyrinogen oxidase
VQEIEDRLPTGITLAGNAYRGAGIPDCVKSGEMAAEAIKDGFTRNDQNTSL